ncbi:MAG: hypothetical protein IBX56_13125 [Methylomicrobium sp.]|nr:hypothetical protein [Methylomicrobium sp.]
MPDRRNPEYGLNQAGPRLNQKAGMNPGYMDVFGLPSLALDARFPAGMTRLM